MGDFGESASKFSQEETRLAFSVGKAGALASPCSPYVLSNCSYVCFKG